MKINLACQNFYECNDSKFCWVDKCLPDIPLTGNLVSKELVDNTKWNKHQEKQELEIQYLEGTEDLKYEICHSSHGGDLYNKDVSLWSQGLEQGGVIDNCKSLVYASQDRGWEKFSYPRMLQE